MICSKEPQGGRKLGGFMEMKNIFKLALLSAAASLLLALPVAANAESRTQVITVDQTPVASTLPSEVITRPVPTIEVVPLTISQYWGTVNLLPEGDKRRTIAGCCL